jgi:adenosylhomocysteine nucleosidase
LNLNALNTYLNNADENADNDWGKNLAKGATVFANLISTQF